MSTESAANEPRSNGTVQIIRRKAKRLFSAAIDACFSGQEDFFPCKLAIDLRKQSPSDPAELIKWNDGLSAAEKREGRLGFRVHRELSTRRVTGRNSYPVAIFFDSLDDLAATGGKTQELRCVRRCEQLFCTQLPKLRTWFVANWRKVIPVFEDLESLVTITQFLVRNPRPGCYVRELPVPVSTKLLERKRNKLLLQTWLDNLLPADQIDFNSGADFETRYGFRKPQRYCLIRILDQALVGELGVPFDEAALTPKAIGCLLRKRAGDGSVWVIENKISMLALPEIQGAIAIGAQGNDLALIEQIPFEPGQQFVYWGDIDVEGFEILARFRRLFARAVSFNMDLETLEANLSLCIPGQGKRPDEPPGLTLEELGAFRMCRDQNLRLEQERVAFERIVKKL